MKAAVVEMPTVLADVQQNMRTAQEYVQRASREGAALIAFPEFFTTGFAFSEAIYDAIADSTDVEAHAEMEPDVWDRGRRLLPLV